MSAVICTSCCRLHRKLPHVLNGWRLRTPRTWKCSRYYSITGDAKQTPSVDAFKKKISQGPSLETFIATSHIGRQEHVKQNDASSLEDCDVPYLTRNNYSGNQRKVYFDVYGCQMNVNDTEIAWGILKDNGFQRTLDITESDVVLVMTCSIRERAEEKIWNRLEYLKHLKSKRQRTKNKPPVKIGILGCMAERLKHNIVEREQAVDLICGPDAYRDLPRMLAVTEADQTAVNVLLSLEETYADIVPVRLNSSSPSAFISIMRGCDNMCTYCIVPFTRGRERSRPISSILEETRALSAQGVKEVTLLGQNVNSYRDTSEIQSYGGYDPKRLTDTSKGFKTVYKPKAGGRRFAELLDHVSRIDPEMRIRFTSPHPKDFPDEVLYLIHERSNICNHLHLPAQSGSTAVLERMRRGYTREAYLDLYHHVTDILPDVSLTSDFIAGFCGETEEDHLDTVSLIRHVPYSFAFCFPYSMRQKTKAHHRLHDDVPQEDKDRRHMELVTAFREGSLRRNRAQIGSTHIILIEGESKKSSQHMAGRTDGNVKVIIPRHILPDPGSPGSERKIAVGDYIAVQITGATSQSMLGTPLYHTMLQELSSDVNNTRMVGEV